MKKKSYWYEAMKGSPMTVSESCFYKESPRAWMVQCVDGSQELEALKLAAPQYILFEAEWVTSNCAVLNLEYMRRFHVVRRALRKGQ